MSRPFRFRPAWFLFALGILGTEVFIALRVHDRFIRPHFGDVLVVVLIHALVRSFLDVSWRRIAVGVFLFACFVEAMQGIHLVDLLGLSGSRFWSTVIGTQGDFHDVAAYAGGSAICVAVESLLGARKTTRVRIPGG